MRSPRASAFVLFCHAEVEKGGSTNSNPKLSYIGPKEIGTTDIGIALGIYGPK